MANEVGSLIFIKIDTKLLVGQTSLSYASACDMIDISSKDTGRHREFAPGKISKTISVSGLGSADKESTAAGYYELETAQDTGDDVAFVVTKFTDETAGTEDAGSEKRTGVAYISNLTWDANDNEAISFSCDLQVSGKPVVATVSA
jgi:predicted secreted protein